MQNKSSTVIIATADLKNRLSRLYEHIRMRRQNRFKHFDHLWDLKEMALLSGQATLEIPEVWWHELENKPDSLHRIDQAE